MQSKKGLRAYAYSLFWGWVIYVPIWVAIEAGIRTKCLKCKGWGGLRVILYHLLPRNFWNRKPHFLCLWFPVIKLTFRHHFVQFLTGNSNQQAALVRNRLRAKILSIIIMVNRRLYSLPFTSLHLCSTHSLPVVWTLFGRMDFILLVLSYLRLGL